MQQRNRDVIALLLQHGADTELTGKIENTPLFYATDVASVELLLRHGANVNPQTIGGTTPLFGAAAAANTAVVTELLRYGANVNHSNVIGDTPLFHAKNVDMARELLRHGANVNAENSNGETPLFRAETVDVIIELITHGANVNHESSNGDTSLFCATNMAKISELLRHGANVNHQNREGNTKLFRAENVDIVKELLRHGADVDHQNHKRETPLFHTTNAASSKELLTHGANVNHQSASGRTALFQAIAKLQRDTVELLIASGADVNVFISAADGPELRLNDGERRFPFTPLQGVLWSFEWVITANPKCYWPPLNRIEHLESYFDIIKRIVPLCDVFSFSGPTDPCVVHFFKTESHFGLDDLIVTKYLLRHGACAEFSLFYDCIFECRFKIKSFSAAFLKLMILAGCSFDGCSFSELKSAPSRQPLHPANASLVESVQELITDLFSQPLSLQELSVMAIRQCIGSRQLWAKIDALPVPSSVKDKIKLKTYSKDELVYIRCTTLLEDHLDVKVCSSVL